MRLLDTNSGQFKWFDNPRVVRYAILSHVWEKPGGYVSEQTFSDIAAIQAAAGGEGSEPESVLSKFSRKIRRACDVAREHGFPYIWIDTCCIDKSSSAELSEAINSMYDWYRWAEVCYAFLDDVEDGDLPSSPDSHFQVSQWFTRGWTLQELIAPHDVLFLSKEWTLIGTKHSLAETIRSITGIRVDVLQNPQKLSDVSVAERMSWASQRRTSRDEDQAYCLIGIFGITMTPIYGEGGDAFIRLQEAILRQIPDQSIFAWGSLHDTLQLDQPGPRPPALQPISPPGESSSSYLFASSPLAFDPESCSGIKTISREDLSRIIDHPVGYSEYTTTPYGVRTMFPLLRFYHESSADALELAFLRCQDRKGRLLALILRPSVSQTRGDASMFVGVLHRSQDLPAFLPAGRRDTYNSDMIYFRLVALLPDRIHAYRARIQAVSDVYISRRLPRIEQSPPEYEFIREALIKSPMNEGLLVDLTRWCITLLSKKNYMLRKNGDSLTKTRHAHDFTLVHGQEHVNIRFGHCPKCEKGHSRGYLSLIVTQPHGDPTGSPAPGHLLCRKAHVEHWDHRDGFAFTSIRLRATSSMERSLRVSLSLEDPGTMSRRSYILDIDVLLHPISIYTTSPLKSTHVELQRISPTDPLGTSTGSWSAHVSESTVDQVAASHVLPSPLANPSYRVERDLLRPGTKGQVMLKGHGASPPNGPASSQPVRSVTHPLPEGRRASVGYSNHLETSAAHGMNGTLNYGMSNFTVRDAQPNMAAHTSTSPYPPVHPDATPRMRDGFSNARVLPPRHMTIHVPVRDDTSAALVAPFNGNGPNHRNDTFLRPPIAVATPDLGPYAQDTGNLWINGSERQSERLPNGQVAAPATIAQAPRPSQGWAASEYPREEHLDHEEAQVYAGFRTESPNALSDGSGSIQDHTSTRPLVHYVPRKTPERRLRIEIPGHQPVSTSATNLAHPPYPTTPLAAAQQAARPLTTTELPEVPEVAVSPPSETQSQRLPTIGRSYTLVENPQGGYYLQAVGGTESVPPDGGPDFHMSAATVTVGNETLNGPAERLAPVSQPHAYGPHPVYLTQPSVNHAQAVETEQPTRLTGRPSRIVRFVRHLRLGKR